MNRKRQGDVKTTLSPLQTVGTRRIITGQSLVPNTAIVDNDVIRTSFRYVTLTKYVPDAVLQEFELFRHQAA